MKLDPNDVMYEHATLFFSVLFLLFIYTMTLILLLETGAKKSELAPN